MKPICLEEMDAIRLMNRVDTKYVTTETQLARILQMADDGYMRLVVDGADENGYDTLYYDTPDMEMYLRHQAGCLVRRKVRVRTYTGSGQTFLEVKKKDNHGRTRKKRMEIPREYFSSIGDCEAASAYVKEKAGYSAEDLFPAVSTAFDRITLVNNGKTERLTIDRNLRFRNVRTGKEASLGDAVIIEIKQDGQSVSPMKDILFSLRIKPLRVSKYCIGTALTDPAVKKGRFREKLRRIEKLTNAKLTY